LPPRRTPTGDFELTIERLGNGEVSPYLTQEVAVGDRLRLCGPIGGWSVWRKEQTEPIQLVAGGSGIVPLMSMIRSRAATGSTAPFRLLYSVCQRHRNRLRLWAFAVTGAGAQPFGAHLGIFWPRILAAALSLSATGALMVLLGVSHPPAGATTLIISLGITSKPRELVIIEVVVFLLVAQALMINRLAGLSYPFWTGPASAKPAEGHLE
jgi:hypothetical protein